MEIYKVGNSSKYPDGVKYGLIFTDLRSKKRVLMDNHHPKGPHVHLDDRELSHRCVDEENLIKDFKRFVLEHMGVKI